MLAAELSLWVPLVALPPALLSLLLAVSCPPVSVLLPRVLLPALPLLVLPPPP